VVTARNLAEYDMKRMSLLVLVQGNERCKVTRKRLFVQVVSQVLL
jgi:hypothetical protein